MFRSMSGLEVISMRECAGTRRRKHEQVFYRDTSCPLCQEIYRADDLMEQRDEAIREVNELKAHKESLQWSGRWRGLPERSY